jgi:hypothetical protein
MSLDEWFYKKTDISNGCDISTFKSGVVHEECWTIGERAKQSLKMSVQIT